MSRQASKYSESLEDYLEAIYMLGGENIRTTDVANHMTCSKASVNRAVNTLQEKGLVQKEPYGDISLTKAGVTQSKRVLKKHLLIKRFLMEVLEVEEERANVEACGIEHNISEDTARRLAGLLEKLEKEKS
ncbi:MAG: metal-dependent transcriptional regulator [Candidatus Izemoplasmatales bacterium]|nr:metal-dependent transcriptional regulator [Candidatus Izemoplasmatales bacterium]